MVVSDVVSTSLTAEPRYRDIGIGRDVQRRRHGVDRRVVDVGDGGGPGAGRAFAEAVPVGIAHHHAHRGADVGIAQRIARLVEADIAEASAAVALPLVMQRSKPVSVYQGRGVGGEHLVLGRRPIDRYRAGRRVVHVGHRRHCRLATVSAVPCPSV